MLYPAELRALFTGKSESEKEIFPANSTVETVKQRNGENSGKLISPTSSGMSGPAATMPERTPTAKRFGARSSRTGSTVLIR